MIIILNFTLNYPNDIFLYLFFLNALKNYSVGILFVIKLQKIPLILFCGFVDARIFIEWYFVLQN